MAIHNITAHFSVGSIRNGIDAGNEVRQISDIEIDLYGSLWGELQVLQLGAHFDLYTLYTKTTRRGVWLHPRRNINAMPILPASMRPSNNKKPGSSITGNFGEAITIMFLEALSNRNLRICHLRASQAGITTQCPDLFFDTAPLHAKYNIARQVEPALPNLPLFMCGECKNSEKEFLSALRQLIDAWLGAPNSPIFGYGLISVVNYRRPANLKFFIIVPCDLNSLRQKLQTPKGQLHVRDFKGALYGF